MIRLFIALEIPEEIISTIFVERDKLIGYVKNIRWEPKEKLHITLKFLGDTEESKLFDIIEELTRIIKNNRKLTLELNKFGVFRKGNEPKILWVGLKQNNFLTKIVDEIDKSFCNFGYSKDERRFKPHLTLLRFRGHEEYFNVLKLLDVKLPTTVFCSDKIHLLKSELKKTGSVYTSIKSFTLEN